MLLNNKELQKLKLIEENTKVKFEQYEMEDEGGCDGSKIQLQKRNWNEDKPKRDFGNN